MSKNENAVHILEKNLDKIYWKCLCKKNKNIISIKGKSFLEKILNNKNNIYYEKIDWKYLSYNENIMYLLEKNINYFEYIDWKSLCQNVNFWDKYNDRCLRKLY